MLKHCSIILLYLILNTTSLFGSATEVINLTIDYQSAPVGIDNKSPRLGWEIVSSGERNIMQASYQILVASTEDLLKNNEADRWDSGEIYSCNILSKF